MTAEEIAKLPRELPAKADGWTKRMIMHLNFGRNGGYGCYELHDEHGTKMPFTFAYNTRDKWRGFLLDDVSDPLTWAQLRERWPAYLTELEKTAEG